MTSVYTSPAVRGRATHPWLQVRAVRPAGKEHAVELVFFLARRATVRFDLFGPAPRCRRVGRVTVSGAGGRNTTRFDGRIRGRRLSPGVYVVVPRVPDDAAQAARSAVTTGVRVDTRGARPAHVPHLDCPPATTAGGLAPGGLEPAGPAFAAVGVEAARLVRNGTSSSLPAAIPPTASPRTGTDVLSRAAGIPWLLIGLFASLLAGSLLITLATVEHPFIGAHFRAAARVLEVRREELALAGTGFLCLAMILFALTELRR